MAKGGNDLRRRIMVPRHNSLWWYSHRSKTVVIWYYSHGGVTQLSEQGVTEDQGQRRDEKWNCNQNGLYTMPPCPTSYGDMQ